MGVSLLYIVPIGLRPGCLVVGLPEGLTVTTVDRTKMKLTYHDGEVGEVANTVQSVLARGFVVTVEAVDVEVTAAESEQTFAQTVGIAEAHAQVQVMGVVLLEQCVGLPEEGGKGFIHEVGAGSVGVAMLGEVRAQGLLDRTSSII